MEYENKYSPSRGTVGTSLGLAIAGTTLGVLNGGGLGNLLGGNSNKNCGCSEAMYVNRYEASQAARIAELEAEIKFRDAAIYTDTKLSDVYERLSTKIAGLEAAICQQNVYNATNTAAINCLNGQIAQLMSLTKLVVPNASVCPGWGNVTVSPATTTTA